MNALNDTVKYATKNERQTVLEERVAKIESDVSFLRGDVLEIKADQRETRQDLKTLTGEFGTFRVEVAKRFGTVDATIESVKRWVVVSGVSAIITLVGFLGTLVAVGHALKWF